MSELGDALQPPCGVCGQRWSAAGHSGCWPIVREYGPNGERLYDDPAYNAIRVERLATSLLVSKSVAQIITFWRPGSGDWSWAEEYAELTDPEHIYHPGVMDRIERDGIAFADSFAPVMLGNDGRVWDGHHRIVAAIKRGIPYLMCEVVE